MVGVKVTVATAQHRHPGMKMDSRDTH